MSLNLPAPKETFKAPANTELTVSCYDEIPTQELKTIFSQKNKARAEFNNREGIPVQSVYILHDEDRIHGAILAEALIEPIFLLTPEGPFIHIQVPWPALQVWANARCEFLKQRVSLNCASKYSSSIKNLMVSMATYEEKFFPLLHFTEGWDETTSQVKRKLISNLIESKEFFPKQYAQGCETRELQSMSL